MLYCVIIHLLNKYGWHLVIFCGLLLNSVFHHVLALEIERMIMFNQGQKSHTHCGNVLRENANYGINYISHPMILICVVNRESVHLWRELLRANEIVHEQCIVEANNLGAFYHFVNTRISNRSTVGAVVDEGLIFY